MGTCLAIKLGVGLLPLRRKGNFPYEESSLASVTYTDYSGKEKGLEVATTIDNSSVLLVDDRIETGATINSCISLLTPMGVRLCVIACIGIDESKPPLNGLTSRFAHISEKISSL